MRRARRGREDWDGLVQSLVMRVGGEWASTGFSDRGHGGRKDGNGGAGVRRGRRRNQQLREFDITGRERRWLGIAEHEAQTDSAADGRGSEGIRGWKQAGSRRASKPASYMHAAGAERFWLAAGREMGETGGGSIRGRARAGVPEDRGSGPSSS